MTSIAQLIAAHNNTTVTEVETSSWTESMRDMRAKAAAYRQTAKESWLVEQEDHKIRTAKFAEQRRAELRARLEKLYSAK